MLLPPVVLLSLLEARQGYEPPPRVINRIPCLATTDDLRALTPEQKSPFLPGGDPTKPGTCPERWGRCRCGCQCVDDPEDTETLEYGQLARDLTEVPENCWLRSFIDAMPASRRTSAVSLGIENMCVCNDVETCACKKTSSEPSDCCGCSYCGTFEIGAFCCCGECRECPPGHCCPGDCKKYECPLGTFNEGPVGYWANRRQAQQYLVGEEAIPEEIDRQKVVEPGNEGEVWEEEDTAADNQLASCRPCPPSEREGPKLFRKDMLGAMSVQDCVRWECRDDDYGVSMALPGVPNCRAACDDDRTSRRSRWLDEGVRVRERFDGQVPRKPEFRGDILSGVMVRDVEYVAGHYSHFGWGGMSRLTVDGGGSEEGRMERSSGFEGRALRVEEDASDLDEMLSPGHRPEFEEEQEEEEASSSSLAGMLASAPRQAGRHRRRRVGDTDTLMPPVEEVRRENGKKLSGRNSYDSSARGEDGPPVWLSVEEMCQNLPAAADADDAAPSAGLTCLVGMCLVDMMERGSTGAYDLSIPLSDMSVKSMSPKYPTVGIYTSLVDMMAALGGSVDPVNDFWMFDTQAQSWSTVVQTGPVPSARHSHSAVEYNASMYVFGGYDGNYRNDFHAFNFISEKWSPVEVAGGSGAGPRARYRTSAVIHNDSMLVFGGHDGSKHLNDFYIFDFLTNTWSMVEPSLSSKVPPPTPRDSHIAAVYGDSMYVFGGSTGTARNDLYEFNLVTRGWNELRRTSAAWRSTSSSNNPDSPAGGEDGMAEQQGDVRPCPRFCHTGVVYRGGLCIFGGYDGQNRLNDFRKFTLGSEVNVEIPESTLLADLRAMVDDPTWSDVVFEVEGKRVYAHKMMCVRCPYFQAMFSPSLNMKESSMSANECIPIQGGVTHIAFKGVLEFLYTDQVHQLTVDSAMDLFMTADQFGIDRLKKICEKEILQSINIDNAPTILQAADMHAASGLRKRCLDFILRNFDAISKTTAFEEMGRQNVELLLEILRMR
ncbi:meprin and TRAF y domain-containing protein MATH domain-containing protein [Perkinsus chesapeaki]|uniref:Meprin and TRAF y domain-containing protein MATH domain-containing protein n=1 Tax=Perkinsus chesapeaki TaxID=330153 RepID=A0A7J6M4W0_PERCH|nr:meprin and TRAF y domain-containing protein MATH domain-containing protein [Perkinsus chesapeaki]